MWEWISAPLNISVKVKQPVGSAKSSTVSFPSDIIEPARNFPIREKKSCRSMVKVPLGRETEVGALPMNKNLSNHGFSCAIIRRPTGHIIRIMIDHWYTWLSMLIPRGGWHSVLPKKE